MRDSWVERFAGSFQVRQHPVHRRGNLRAAAAALDGDSEALLAHRGADAVELLQPAEPMGTGTNGVATVQVGRPASTWVAP